ncbi:DUF1636 domain-containing protein [Tritonibacter aquimaris]
MDAVRGTLFGFIPPYPAYSAEGRMVTNTPCRISVCTSCKDRSGTRPGYQLIERLQSELARNDMLQKQFQVAGVACMAGCNSPCAVGFHGLGKATYLFGDLTPADDVDDIVTFAQQYLHLHDGWCSSVDRPGKLRKSTLARVPATLFTAPPIAEASE